MEELQNDPCVTDKKNIFEYVLDGCQDKKLLNVRVFDENIKRRVYNRQTAEAKEKTSVTVLSVLLGMMQTKIGFGH